jgi:hypothetical protein
VLAILVLVLAPAVTQEQEPAVPAPPDLAPGVARILSREEPLDARAIAAGARELLALGDVEAILLQSLGTGCIPETEDGGGGRLGADQGALLRAAVAGLGPARLAAFVGAVEREPSSATSVAAALRVLALRPDSTVASMLALARTAEANGSGAGVEDALEEALAAVFRRSPRDCAAVAGEWRHLGPLTASVAVRALEHTSDPEAVRCLGTLLGRRSEFDACVLSSLANQAERVARTDAATLAEEVQAYLRSEDSACAQAACSVLARLGVPSSVPGLIEHVEDDDPLVSRAVLSALQAIGGVALPPSAAAWRAWFGREDRWWREEAPPAIEALAQAGELGTSLADLVTLSRDLSEHPLFRDELVVAFGPLLAHPEPGARVLACQALERLGSRLALPDLCAHLEDRDREVISAAHTALVALTGVDLPAKRGRWTRYLASQSASGQAVPPLGMAAAAR